MASKEPSFVSGVGVEESSGESDSSGEDIEFQQSVGKRLSTLPQAKKADIGREHRIQLNPSVSRRGSDVALQLP